MVTEAGSYLRLIYSCITQLKAQGPSRSCNESKEAEEVCNMAYIRQSRPDSGLGFQVKVLEIFQVVSSSLGNGTPLIVNSSNVDDP